MRIRALCLVAVMAPGAGATAAQITVATLHPLLADLVRQVGGDRVQVVELFKPGGDVHHFEPSPQDLVQMKGAAFIFASGKHLENYLDNLRDSAGGCPWWRRARWSPP